MKVTILLAFALLLTASVDAQELTISNSNITEKDNRVTVCFSVTPSPLGSNKKLTLTPVLYASSGVQSLDSIVVVGRDRAISDKRMGYSPSIRYTKGLTIPYTLTLPYAAWMSEVSLRIERKEESCCKEKQLSPTQVVTSKLIHYDIHPNYSSHQVVPEPTELSKYDNKAALLYPMSAYQLRQETTTTLRAEGALRIYFTKGSWEIDPIFKDNHNVLTELRKVIALIQADTTATLEKIVILGLASPEGDLSKNTTLAAQRAESLKRYLSTNIPNADTIFDIIPAGEDWEELVKLIQASDMPYKQEVLDIIENYEILEGREKRLLDLKWGRPYNYMLEHFFPQLRNAGCIQIYYESSVDRSVASLNHAIALINNKQYSDALEALRTLKGDARVDNLRGVALMMMGDDTQAEEYFIKAVAQGSKEAPKNLEEIQIRHSINQ